MNRRSFIAALASGMLLDKDRLLYRPGAKLISIPKPTIIPAYHPSFKFSGIEFFTFNEIRPNQMVLISRNLEDALRAVKVNYGIGREIGRV